MLTIGSTLGFVSSFSSILLWIVMIFFNPYNPGFESDVMFNTLITLFIPACIVLVGTSFNHSLPVYIGFVISLPMSMYMLGTPGIFLLFGVTSCSYLVTAILFSVHNRKNKHKEALRNT